MTENPYESTQAVDEQGRGKSLWHWPIWLWRKLNEPLGCTGCALVVVVTFGLFFLAAGIEVLSWYFQVQRE